MRRFCFLLPALSMCLVSCMKQDIPGDDNSGFAPVKGQSLFVVSEGQFGNGNATLSCYNVATGECVSEVFEEANGIKLGDVAQSMTIHGDKGWIVVNNSQVIFAVNLSDMKVAGQITGIVSPRYIHFVSDTKAYVTSMYSTDITVINPRDYSIVKTIKVGHSIETVGYDGETQTAMVGGERMVEAGGFLYVNLYSYGKKIVKIDISTDNVVGELEVGVQPKEMALDADGRLWVITDGGYYGNPVGYEEPALHLVDLQEFEVSMSLKMEGLTDYYQHGPVSSLQTDKAGRTLYWLRDGVWKMDISASALPAEPFISKDGISVPYSLTVSPYNGDVFVSDALDYMQNGNVYIYSAAGVKSGDFSVGVCPGSFCWY